MFYVLLYVQRLIPLSIFTLFANTHVHYLVLGQFICSNDYNVVLQHIAWERHSVLLMLPPLLLQLLLWLHLIETTWLAFERTNTYNRMHNCAGNKKFKCKEID